MKTLETEKENVRLEQIELQIEQTLLLILSSALEKLKARLSDGKAEDDIKF